MEEFAWRAPLNQQILCGVMHHSNAGNLGYVKYADEKHTRYGTHNHEGEGGIMFFGAPEETHGV